MPFLLPLCFLCSLCSMLYELSLAKTIALMTHQVVLWESITIGVFIGSVGLGLLKKNSRTVLNQQKKDLLMIEIFLFFLGIFSIPLLLFLDMEQHIYFETFGYEKTFLFMSKNLFFGFLAQTMTVVLGFFSGREFKIILELGDKSSVKFSIIYALYYGGALCGTIMFTHVFSVFMDPLFISFISASINLLLVTALLIPFFRQKYSWPALAMTLTLISFQYQCFKKLSWLNSLYLKNKYYNTISWDLQNDLMLWKEPSSLKEFIASSSILPDIKRIHTPYQIIDIASDLTDKTKKHFTLYLDGHYQFNTQIEHSYHETMAYVPMLLFKKTPQKILILGGGDGLLAREFLQDENVQITLVELDPTVTKIASKKEESLFEFNKASLNSSRLSIIHDDAFTWLRHHKETFDAIYMDFPLPFTYDGTRLYSADFFKMVKHRLNAHGFIVVDVLIKSDKQKHIMFETLYYAGYETLYGFKGETDSFITGTVEKKELNRKYFQLPFKMLSLNQDEFENGDLFFSLPKPHVFSRVNHLLKPQEFEVF